VRFVGAGRRGEAGCRSQVYQEGAPSSASSGEMP
jgi:hypothetical protein